MTCVLKPGESTCDYCKKRGVKCEWKYAGTPGGPYHLERFGRVPLSEPYVDLWLNGATAPSATNGVERATAPSAPNAAPMINIVAPSAPNAGPVINNDDDEEDDEEEDEVNEMDEMEEEDDEEA